MLLADDLPNVPIQITALGIIFYFVWFFLRRLERTDEANLKEARERDTEIAALQTKLETLIVDNAEQHRIKHDALNRLTVVEGQAKLIKRAARLCTCHALDPVRVFMEEDL